MRHIISILLQNEAGALARVASMFSSRGYNIDSLSVAPTQDQAVSRLTLVTSGSEAVIEQIIKQARKLIDVVEIVDLSVVDHVECELVIVKVRLLPEQANAFIHCVRDHHAITLDGTDNTRTTQLAGTSAQIAAFIAALSQFSNVMELVRSGVAAVQIGQHVVSA
ncbi:acetolactate synthase small subunit [Sinimarinibacterium sp. NLF-5-8]|uniref:acetolactate synthase small subunit n=1 Tax=Sinimarinibacterium sp. NLF-5-8 TaxID=2698684 RepID=UPI00137BFCCD|nr:acetolactate synthase small subunit [Sinimarinibacterium sp. NLF-5-8]QHS08728.1 acetolactate synthase small subunit [Sinimarinibacterium sp. NLF-5-8]